MRGPQVERGVQPAENPQVSGQLELGPPDDPPPPHLGNGPVSKDCADPRSLEQISVSKADANLAVTVSTTPKTFVLQPEAWQELSTYLLSKSPCPKRNNKVLQPCATTGYIKVAVLHCDERWCAVKVPQNFHKRYIIASLRVGHKGLGPRNISVTSGGGSPCDCARTPSLSPGCGAEVDPGVWGWPNRGRGG